MRNGRSCGAANLSSGTGTSRARSVSPAAPPSCGGLADNAADNGAGIDGGGKSSVASSTDSPAKSESSAAKSAARSPPLTCSPPRCTSLRGVRVLNDFDAENVAEREGAQIGTGLPPALRAGSCATAGDSARSIARPKATSPSSAEPEGASALKAGSNDEERRGPGALAGTGKWEASRR